ncbi:MAG TPA: response regulator, partial [Nitrospiria bacterium]
SNDEQIMTLLEGLLRMPDMEYVGLRVDDRVRWEAGALYSNKVVAEEYPLVYPYRGEDIQIGVLRAVASLDNVYLRIWNRVFVILASNALKTFLVAGFILFLFQNWVTRHLVRIAEYTRRLRLQETSPPLDLDREKPSMENQGDELDQVVSAINEMRSNAFRAFEDRKNSEARYRELFENSPSPLWEMDFSELKSGLRSGSLRDPSGLDSGVPPSSEIPDQSSRLTRVVDLNVAALKLFEGRDKEFLIRDLPIRLTASSPAVFQGLVRALQNNKLAGEIEAPVRTLLRNRKDLLLRWEVLPGHRETWSRILVTATDLTERKKTENQRRVMESHIQETQRLESLGVLAGGIAHDFNNLLVGILGNADLALEELPPRGKGREYVEQIGTAAGRAADLTRQLLAYSGQGKFVIKQISLNPLIEEMVRLLKTALSRGAKLGVKLGKDLPAIEADSTQIRQVIMNLVMNASDALDGKRGEIEIKTGTVYGNRAYLSQTLYGEDLAEGKYVFVEVSDTGSGMNSETRSKIFDPFFTTKETGHGLGLAAVSGIVRGHGGSIRIFSQPGQGTRMTVLFPPSDRPVGSPASKSKKTTPWKGTGLIMIVDDDEMAVDVIEEMLKRQGFTVCSFSNGLEALEMYRKQSSDIVLVLLDMTMPYMDGWATYREMRRTNPEVKVIMVSGYSEQEAIGRYGEGEVSGFVQKPFSQAELLSRVRGILGAE